MVNFSESYEKQLAYFVAEKVDTSYPGFYDGRAFMSIEAHNPDLLNNYASFVKQRPFDRAYTEKVDNVIPTIARLLNGELKKDGRQGACIDASMALSRMLEKQSIWNYVAKGSLTISFPSHTKISKKFFWSVDNGAYTAAHAWVVAPPYRIIDITLRQQPYKQSEKDYLPEVILRKETVESELDLEDIVQPDILRMLEIAHGKNQISMMNSISATLASFTRYFKPEGFVENDINFRYSPTGVIAPDLPFEESTSLKLNGFYGIDIYNNVIIPELK